MMYPDQYNEIVSPPKMFLIICYCISEKNVMDFGLIYKPFSITGALFRKFPHIQKLGKSLPDLQSPSDFFLNLRKDHKFMGKLSRTIETVLIFQKLKNFIFFYIFRGGPDRTYLLSETCSFPGRATDVSDHRVLGDEFSGSSLK